MTAAVEAAPLTESQARKLTEDIRYHAEQSWSLLKEAHDRRAYEALGYDGFGAYVEAEFQMSRGNAWRLINQGKVVHELAEAANLAPEELPPVTARTANALAPVADKVARKVSKAVAGKRPAQRKEIAARIIEHEADVARARQAAPMESSVSPDGAVPDVIAALLGSKPAELARACADPRKVGRDLRSWADQFVAIAYGGLSTPADRRAARDAAPVTMRPKASAPARSAPRTGR